MIPKPPPALKAGFGLFALFWLILFMGAPTPGSLKAAHQAVGLSAGFLVLVGSAQRVAEFGRRHPLWGRDPAYPLLLGLNNQLLRAWGLTLVGGAFLIGEGILALLGEEKPDSGEAVLPLFFVGYGLPWVLASLPRRLPRRPPQVRPFRLLEDEPGSLNSREVRGAEIDSEGRLLIVWKRRGWRLGSGPGQDEVRVAVRGIRIPESQRGGDWVRALSRAAVWRQTAGNNPVSIHDLPLFRLAESEEGKEAEILAEHSYGEWQRPGSFQRYSSLADLLVRWGFAVRWNEVPVGAGAPWRVLGRESAPRSLPHSASGTNPTSWRVGTWGQLLWPVALGSGIAFGLAEVEKRRLQQLAQQQQTCALAVKTRAQVELGMPTVNLRFDSVAEPGERDSLQFAAAGWQGGQARLITGSCSASPTAELSQWRVEPYLSRP